MGLPVLLASGGGGGAVLVAAVEVLVPARLEELRAAGAGVVLALAARRAQTLKVAAYDGDLARIAVPAEANAGWLRALADPSRDLAVPLKGPFPTVRDGDAGPARAALALAKSARLLPAALTVPVAEAEADRLAEGGLTRLAVSGIAPPEVPPAPERVASARLPLDAAGEARLHVFRLRDGSEEHYALEIGRPDRAEPVLTRLHSACFTGDVLGSLKCDCGPQLHGALAQMAGEGAGVLLYLNQEGRGIGLANKMRAYALQDEGFDTVEANHRLGFDDDERDFRIGSQMLAELGISRVRLLTNNPEKLARMQEAGIVVTERVPLRAGANRFNHHYLATKAAKSGHLL
jgi:GTP cyclohydrolase II